MRRRPSASGAWQRCSRSHWGTRSVPWAAPRWRASRDSIRSRAEAWFPEATAYTVWPSPSVKCFCLGGQKCQRKWSFFWMSGLFHLILSTNWLPFRCLLERGLIKTFGNIILKFCPKNQWFDCYTDFKYSDLSAK